MELLVVIVILLSSVYSDGVKNVLYAEKHWKIMTQWANYLMETKSDIE